MKNARRIVRQNWKLVGSMVLLFGLAICIEGSCRFGSADAGAPYEHPSTRHWLGTVDWGGDMAYYLRGALVRSLLIAGLISVPSVVVGYLIGGLWALSSAGGLRERALLVLVIGVLGPTPVVLMLAILHIFPEPNSTTALAVAMSAMTWPGIAIRCRSELQDLLDRPYIRVARAQGTGHFELLTVDLLPLMMPILEKTMLFAFVFGIESEAIVGYLGVGETRPSIGRLLQESMAAFELGEPRIVHGLRYMLVVGVSLGSVVGALKLFAGWRDDRRVLNSIHEADGRGVQSDVAGWRVDVAHRSSSAKLLSNASIPYLPGKITVVAGASGGGKSLAVRAIAELLPVELKASIEARGQVPTADEIVIVPQGMQEHFSDSFSIGQYLEFARIRPDEAEGVLSSVGLTIQDLKESSGNWKTGRQVSGGMSQKLAVALVSSGTSKVLVFDETIAALDRAAASEFGNLMRRFVTSRADLAVVVVNHRHHWTREFADHIIFMDSGSTVWSGQNSDFWNESRSTGRDEPRAVNRYKSAVSGLNARDSTVKRTGRTVLKVNKLVSPFGRSQSPVSFELRSGEILAITGPNGSGKTSILRTIAGELQPIAGNVEFVTTDSDATVENGPKIVSSPPVLRMCSQNPTDVLNPSLPIQRILSNTVRRVASGNSGPMAELIKTACAKARFPARHLTKTPSELSGGLRIRAGLACSLVGDVQILLLDEPTAGLDPEVAHEVLDTFREISLEGTAIIAVIHDPEQLDYLGATRVSLCLDT